jgi:hypothetical protein
VWEFRYRDHCGATKRLRQLTLSTAHYPSEAQARHAVEGMLIRLSTRSSSLGLQAEPVFGTLIDRFIGEERLIEISMQNPGETFPDGLQYSTACSYLSMGLLLRSSKE